MIFTIGTYKLDIFNLPVMIFGATQNSYLNEINNVNIQK